MDALERLLAVEEIKQLKARFFMAVDDKDWAAYATLFTDDARFDVDGALDGAAIEGLDAAGNLAGGQAMAVLVSKLLEDSITIHIGGLPVIELVSERDATAVWPVEDWLWASAEGSTPLHGFGRYHERYVRGADGWRISRLRYTRALLIDHAHHAAINAGHLEALS